MSNCRNNLIRCYLHIYMPMMILLVTSCGSNMQDGAAVPEPVKGTLDIRKWDFKNNGGIPLAGEWEFYWNKLLSFEDFTDSDKKVIPSYVSVPQSWTRYMIEGDNLPYAGYATYRLRVKTDGASRLYAIRVPNIYTAAKIYINDKLVTSVGTVGVSRDNAKAFTKPQITIFYPPEPDFEIIVHVSNYFFKMSGMTETITFGVADGLLDHWSKNIIIGMFIIGAIFIMSLYHLVLYALIKKNKALLYFAFVCLMIAIRSFVQQDRYVLEFIPWLSFEVMYKLEFVSWFLGVAAFGLFVYKLFNAEFSKKALNAILAVFTILSLFVLVTPLRIYSYIMELMMLFTLMAMLYILFVVIRAVIRKRNGSKLFATGLIVLILFTTNDILVGAKILLFSTYMLPIGLFIFIFIQSFLLSSRFAESYKTTERLSKKMEADNENLSMMIDDIRTSANELANFSGTLKDTVATLQKEMNEQAESLEITVTAVDEVSVSIESIVNNAERQKQSVNINNSIIIEYIESLKKITDASKHADSLSRNSIEKARLSRDSMDMITTGMKSMGEASGKINEITGIINDIAEETNLLSLNASIEAARAGGYGRGFAVVAEEIGKLADKSIQQAKLIQEHVKSTVSNIDEETNIILNSSNVINEIGNSVNEVSNAISTIWDLCMAQEQMAKTIQENSGNIADGVSEINDATNEQKAVIFEISDAVDKLNIIMAGVVNNTNTLNDSMIVLHGLIQSLNKITER